MNCHECGEFAFYIGKGGIRSCEKHKVGKMKREFNKEALIYLCKDRLIGEYEDIVKFNTLVTFKCIECDKTDKKMFKIIIDCGGGLFCKDCMKRNREIKKKERCVQKYGVEHHLQLPEIREKQKATNFTRYGKEHVSQVSEFKNKIKETNLNIYGLILHKIQKYPKNNSKIHSAEKSILFPVEM